MRAALLALSLAAVAWFVIGIRQATDTSRASAIIPLGTRMSANQARQAADLLNAAAFLNPDKQVNLLRAKLADDQGNDTEARAILKRVVADEPDNLAAWILLAHVSFRNLPEFYAAAYRIRQLAPPAPGSH